MAANEPGIFHAVGRTPAVPLDRLFPSGKLHVYGKLEWMNPSGSAKDRPAAGMIRDAWKRGLIGPGSVIVESSSGNLAISLAWICAALGMTFICVVDPKTSQQNIRILEAYGARIEPVTAPDPATGEFLPARLARVKQLTESIEGAYWPNQYGNDHNYLAHKETMRELLEQTGPLDYLFAGVSTCGTIKGCAEWVRGQGLATRLVAVDAEGSVIFGGVKGKRRFPGLGAGIAMPFAQAELLERVEHISDEEMVAGCRLLLRTEGVMAGPSTGGVVAAVRRLEPILPAHAAVGIIMHDRGDRYLDTVYSDVWVKEQFGGIPLY
ncbi:2,3-diaminopropionate biosynthesis protein SbnA [Paenibacillus protaetiae]|uniref:N-(2-amino-2-carboxyethyl)-L-glutamate synthase n=1 Tax=Paenibacillus protaetiae TaxID=2509456 RepID=A0A4V0YES4_9BACL|nr:2,3-diaminopropionate biosynthesis protein SbnA [Paenibacillus protaetiae]QAY65221.1 2,3-diaminopropionate biosynthesis protein SbnA [Paenibacillus protaetiae]